MPIRRYRTFDEAQRAQWLPSDDPRIAKRLRQVLDLWARLRPVARPPGLHRFHSGEEWQEWRESCVPRNGGAAAARPRSMIESPARIPGQGSRSSSDGLGVRQCTSARRLARAGHRKLRVAPKRDVREPVRGVRADPVRTPAVATRAVVASRRPRRSWRTTARGRASSGARRARERWKGQAVTRIARGPRLRVRQRQAGAETTGPAIREPAVAPRRKPRPRPTAR